MSLIKTEDGLAYLVKWDDSEEIYRGWNMAWEEFVWCLGVVNKPIEEAAKKAAAEEAQRRAEEAEAAAAVAEAEAEENEEATEVEVEATEVEESTTEDLEK